MKLGTPHNLTAKARQMGSEAMRLKALQNENNRKATALIISLRNAGNSYGKIADELNKSGFKTSRAVNLPRLRF